MPHTALQLARRELGPTELSWAERHLDLAIDWPKLPPGLAPRRPISLAVTTAGAVIAARLMVKALRRVEPAPGAGQPAGLSR